MCVYIMYVYIYMCIYVCIYFTSIQDGNIGNINDICSNNSTESAPGRLRK